LLGGFEGFSLGQEDVPPDDLLVSLERLDDMGLGYLRLG
jgi:hypothetical protein